MIKFHLKPSSCSTISDFVSITDKNFRMRNKVSLRDLSATKDRCYLYKEKGYSWRINDQIFQKCRVSPPDIGFYLSEAMDREGKIILIHETNPHEFYRLCIKKATIESVHSTLQIIATLTDWHNWPRRLLGSIIISLFFIHITKKVY